MPDTPDNIIRLHVAVIVNDNSSSIAYLLAALDADIENIHQKLNAQLGLPDDSPEVVYTSVDLPLPDAVVRRLSDSEHDLVAVTDGPDRVVIRVPKDTDWKWLCRKAATEWCLTGPGKPAYRASAKKFTWADFAGIDPLFLAKYGVQVVDGHGTVECTHSFKADLVDGALLDTSGKGYAVTDFDGTGMLEIQKVDAEGVFPSDAEAVTQAVMDGIPVIPVDELPDGFDRRYLGWLDTPANRDRIMRYCEKRTPVYPGTFVADKGEG